MALTRSMLKGMNLTDEQVSAIIDAHTESTDALKKQRDEYKADADKLVSVQKELDDLKNGKDWKAEHDTLKQAFDDYKAEIANKEKLASVKAAYRKLLEAEKIGSEDADLIMAATKFDGMKLGDDGKLTDSDSITDNIKQSYARYIPKVSSEGDNPATPPKGDDNGAGNSEIRAMTAKWHAAQFGEAKSEK